MKSSIIVCMLILFSLGIAAACDDHVGKCEIEDWRAVKMVGGMVTIEGSTTCNKGIAHIRLYHGETFLGTAIGLIGGHMFSAIAMEVDRIDGLSIKYSIDPDG